MKETKEFKREFLRFNQLHLDEYIRIYNVAIVELNNVVKAAKIVLDRPLTDKEKRVIETDGIDFVLNEIRVGFPFPKGLDQVNYDALGVNITDLTATELIFMQKRSEYTYTLLDDLFVASQEQLELIKEQNSVYSVNERQNNALIFAPKMIELLNEGENLSLITQRNKGLISKLFSCIEYSLDKEKNKYTFQTSIKNIVSMGL
jgi:hypothetical protein